MGVYKIQGGLWDHRPFYKWVGEEGKGASGGGDFFLFYSDEESKWLVGTALGIVSKQGARATGAPVLQVKDTALSPLEIIGTWQAWDASGRAWTSEPDVYIRNISES